MKFLKDLEITTTSLQQQVKQEVTRMKIVWANWQKVNLVVKYHEVTIEASDNLESII